MNIENLKQYKDTNYYLNSDGKVYRKYKNGLKKINGCIDIDQGYRRKRIHIGNKKYNLSRLVWETFVGEIPSGYVIEHRNGCSTMDDLVNLRIVKITDGKRFQGKNKNTRKIINLLTREIYKGTRDAASKLKHSRKSIETICKGKQLARTNIEIAWWDDVNGKAFRGDYKKYFNKYMKEVENEFRAKPL